MSVEYRLGDITGSLGEFDNILELGESRLTVDYTVTTTGDGSSSSAWISNALWLSTDDVFGNDDDIFLAWDTHNFATNSTETETFYFPEVELLPAGVYNLFLEVNYDASRGVLEPDISNNVSEPKKLVVYDGIADFEISTALSATGSIRPGEDPQFKIVVENRGESVGDSFELGYFVSETPDFADAVFLGSTPTHNVRSQESLSFSDSAIRPDIYTPASSVRETAFNEEWTADLEVGKKYYFFAQANYDQSAEELDNQNNVSQPIPVWVVGDENVPIDPLLPSGLAEISGTNSAKETLTGTEGSDLIFGLAGNDIINGGGGDDIIVAGPGSDFKVYGGSGADTFVHNAGDGVIVIRDFEVGLDKILLSDQLNFQDLEIVSGGNLSIYTGYTGDKIVVQSVDGRPADVSVEDFVFGSLGAQIDDTPVQEPLNEIVLLDDVYPYVENENFGKTYIVDDGTGSTYLSSFDASQDKIRITGNWDFDDLVFEYRDASFSSEYVIITTSSAPSSGDSIRIDSGSYSSISLTEASFEFSYVAPLNAPNRETPENLVDISEGNALEGALLGTDAAERILGFEGLETIKAGGGNDLIIPGTGDNLSVYGGDGADTFVHNDDDQLMIIRDFDSGLDKLHFTGDWSYDDLTFSQIGSAPYLHADKINPFSYPSSLLKPGYDALLIETPVAGDQILLLQSPNFFTLLATDFEFGPLGSVSDPVDPETPIDLPQISGTDENRETLTGTDVAELVLGLGGNDIIYAGGGDDIVDPGQGADWKVFGGAGADTFVQNDGDGVMVIRDFEDGNDKIRFTGDLSFDDLNINHNPGVNSFTILTPTTDDRVIIKYSGDAPTITASDFEFGPLGEMSTPTDPEDPVNAFEIVGTDAKDTLRGGNEDEILLGLDGNDIIFGGGGNDVISGGKGSDYNLNGGDGDDVFLFAAGDGIGVIRDFTDGEDVLQFTNGAVFADLEITHESGLSRFYIEGPVEGDRVTLLYSDVAPTLNEEDFIFS